MRPSYPWDGLGHVWIWDMFGCALLGGLGLGLNGIFGLGAFWIGYVWIWVVGRFGLGLLGCLGLEWDVWIWDAWIWDVWNGILGFGDVWGESWDFADPNERTELVSNAPPLRH